MPRNASRDPYARSMQWSRRFTGLPLFCALAAAGFDGYARELRELCRLADHLRDGLRAAGWQIVNDTPLPLVCFVDGARRDGKFLDAVARSVIASNGGWISMTRLANGERVLRACVNNHRTEDRDIDRLIEALGAARESLPE
jgi:glutamate/tyrosine decarboxylase-like PLP-dependent enzyme